MQKLIAKLGGFMRENKVLIAVLGLVMTLLFGAAGHCASPVWWMAELGPDNMVSVSVRAHVRIKDVNCQLKFLDERNREIGTLSFQFTGNDLQELVPEKKYVKSFPHQYKEATEVQGIRLFAVPLVSSPKAVAGTNISELEKGVPPYGQDL